MWCRRYLWKRFWFSNKRPPSVLSSRGTRSSHWPRYLIYVLSFFWLLLFLSACFVVKCCEWMGKISGLWSLERADLSTFKSELGHTWLLSGPCLMGHPLCWFLLSVEEGTPPLAWVREWLQCVFGMLWVCGACLSSSFWIQFLNSMVMILLGPCGLCSSPCELQLSIAFPLCAPNRGRYFAFFAAMGFPLSSSCLL